MSITRNLLDWIDEKTDEVDVDNDKRGIAKLVGLSVIESIIDTAVLMVPIVTVAGVVYAIKNHD